jgi:soluble lytic murein transglycosylase-like protein
MLRRAAHLFIAAWLMSAVLTTADRPFGERRCVGPEIIGPAGISTGEPRRVDASHLEDGVPYQDLIRSVAKHHGVPADLVVSVIRHESNFNPGAISPRGAGGLMQLMPDTAAELGIRDIFDVEENLEGGVRYLRGLLERFSGDVALAVAAYNAGAEVVKRHGGIPPYPETQRYVERILTIYQSLPERSISGGSGATDSGIDLAILTWSDLSCRFLGLTLGTRHDSS